MASVLDIILSANPLDSLNTLSTVTLSGIPTMLVFLLSSNFVW